MRVIAGQFKNMEIKPPKGTSTRPTTARVREAVMSMLTPWLSDAVIVDFFAGSGAFSIEALSRGAKAALLIENHKPALSIIRENIQSIKLKNPSLKIQFEPKDAFSLANKFTQGFENPDIVWADPPYDKTIDWLNKYCDDQLHFPIEDGCLMIESRRIDQEEIKSILDSHSSFYLSKLKTYGDTAITLAIREK